MKAWLKLGFWKLGATTSEARLLPDTQFEVLMAYKRATLAGGERARRASFEEDENTPLTITLTLTLTLNAGDHYKSWHAWALLNFRLAKQFKKFGQRDAIISGVISHTRHAHAPSRYLKNHIVASATGFLKAISLGKKRWSASAQQDMLNFLNVLFEHGELKEVSDAINKNIKR